MAYNKTPFKMMGKSPMMKALVGNQKNLNQGLKAAILASPVKQGTKKVTLRPKEPSDRQKSIDRLDNAVMTKDSSMRNRKAAQLEKQAAQLDLKAQKNDRQKARKEKRKAKKGETGKTGLGRVINKVKDKVSPTKQMSKLKKSSPAKQTDTKLKDIPEVLENTGKKVIEKGKKVIKDIGNITLSSKERKACKEKGGRFKKGKCYMPESPAKKKGCSKKY